MNYNEDLSKNYQLGYWVQNNLTERPTHFIRTKDLYRAYQETFNAYDNKILTLDGFSKAVNKTIKNVFFKFYEKKVETNL